MSAQQQQPTQTQALAIGVVVTVSEGSHWSMNHVRWQFERANWEGVITGISDGNDGMFYVVQTTLGAWDYFKAAELTVREVCE